MGLRLHTVAPARGWAWLRQGLRLWLQRPLAFVGLFVFFLFTVLLLMVLLPVVGGALGMALLPMLSLGFIIASRAALAGEPVPRHLGGVVQMRPDRSRRRAQWQLCASFAAVTTLLMLLAHWVDGGLFDDWQRAMADSQGGRSPELDAIMADPRLVQGLVVRFGGAALLSLPYWHAPALVHFAGQGAAQALFSSTLAVWQARGAFVVYLLGWLAVAIGMGAALMLLATLLGMPSLLGVLVLPMGLILSTLFYVSLWFCFRDSFREDGSTPGA